MNESRFAGRVSSPLGDLVIFLTDTGLEEIRIGPPRFGRPDPPVASSGDPLFLAVREQLAGYFRGERQTFNLPLAPVGTAFDLAVWAAVRAVPFGVTTSYAEIAHRTGHPGAARAVGTANARNPLLVVIPCHRIITADRRLTGRGAGRARRRWLLEHEGLTVRKDRVIAAEPGGPS